MSSDQRMQAQRQQCDAHEPEPLDQLHHATSRELRNSPPAADSALMHDKSEIVPDSANGRGVISDKYFRSVIGRLVLGALITGGLLTGVLIFNSRERKAEIVSKQRFGHLLNAIGQQRAVLERIRDSLDRVAANGIPVTPKDAREHLVKELDRFEELQSAVAKYGFEESANAAEQFQTREFLSTLRTLARNGAAEPDQIEQARRLIADEHARFNGTIDQLMKHEIEHHEEQHVVQAWMELIGLSAMIVAVFGITAPALAFLRRQNRLLKKQSEQLVRLSMVAKCTSNAVAMTDVDGRIRWVNPGYELLSGYKLSEVAGTAWPAWLERRSPANNRHHEICAAISSGAPLRCQTMKRHKSGQTYFIEVDVQPLYVSGGKLSGYQFVETDITHQKETENRLRESREYMDAMLMAIGDGVISTDRMGNVSNLNPAAESLTGWTSLDAQGMPVEEIFRSSTEAEFNSPISPARIALSSGHAASIAKHLYLTARDNRRLIVATSATPMHDAHGEICGAVIIFRDVTAEHERERTLKEINERFETATIAAGFGIWDFEYKHGRLIWDESCYRLYQLQHDRNVDAMQAWCSAIHPDDLDTTIQTFETAVAARKELNCEFRIIRGDGEERVLRARGRVVNDAEGRIVRLTGINFDITAQREAERNMQVEHHRAESALDGGNLGLWDWNIATNEVIYDRRWATMVGEPLHDLPQRFDTWRSRVHAQDLAEAESRLAEHLANPAQPYDHLHRMRHSDGMWRWMRARGRVVEFDAEEKPLRMVGTHTDVTHERQMQLDLQRSENALSATSRMTRVGSWEYDPSTNQITWSETAADIFAIPEWSIIDFQELLDAFSADGQIQLEEAMRVATDQGEPFDLELPILPSDGKAKWVRVIGHAECDQVEQLCRVTGAFQDITETHERQLELEEATAKAKEMAIVAEAATRSKSEFLANMSHELRTPLTAILGFTDILADGESLEPQAPRYQEVLATIKRNGEHLLSLINDILDVSKVEAGQMKLESVACETRQIIEDVVTMIGGKASEKNIRLERTYGTHVPSAFYADPVRLKQILVNLLSNAIKFTDSGGEVHLVISVDKRTNEVDRLVLRVIDTGIGMNDEQMGRLFQPFSQADTTVTRRFGGTGLGLVISKRLANMMGGDIDVRSEQGKGSTFTASIACKPVEGTPWVFPDQLDATEKSVPQPVANAPKASVPKFPGLRVLVAEDGPDNQRLLSFLLKKAEVAVTIVDNGLKAVEAMTNDGKSLIEPTPFDLILMDMQMPVMDGYTASRRLRQLQAELPIVALTAHAMAGDREKCIDAGCSDYLNKPIDRDKFFSLLAEHYQNLDLAKPAESIGAPSVLAPVSAVPVAPSATS